MTEPTSKPAAAKPKPSGRAGDVVLLVAFAIFAAAMGAVLHIVLEVEPEQAALAAMSGLSVLVAIHAVVRRASLVATLDAEIAKLKAELADLKGRPQPKVSTLQPKGLAESGGPELIGPVPATSDTSSAVNPAPTKGLAAAAPLNRAPRAPVHTPSTPRLPANTEPGAAQFADARTEAPPPPTTRAPEPPNHSAEATLAAPKPGPDTEMAPYWALRPGIGGPAHWLQGIDTNGQFPPTGPLPMIRAAEAPAAAAVEPVARPVAAPPPAVATAEPAPVEPAPVLRAVATDARVPKRSEAQPTLASWPKAAPRDAGQPLDLGTMQSLIAQLAQQLNQPRTADDEPAGDTETPAAVAAVEIAAKVLPELAPVSPSAPAAGPHSAGQTSASVGTRQPLRRLALAPVSMAPVGRLALIAEAVEANRMDVYLDPILGLADRKARHFELSVRLLTETNEELDADAYTGPASGTGLLGRIDSAKLARAAEVAQRLKQRGSRASLFSNIAGESLADENFIGAFADLLDAEDGLGAKLVLTFTQADARSFTGAHWDAISAMSEIGLKFALEDVRDLDMDFSLLRHHGFDFVKLDAAVFLDGLPTPSGHVPAVDICRHLSQLGLGLIVGGIVAERDLAKILGFGALLGQGTLFGAPRSVQLDVERQAA